jgi:hypothetical protein
MSKSLINKDGKITCKTCYYKTIKGCTFKKVNLVYGTVYDFCLLKVNEEDYKHPRYSHLERKYTIYKYLCWRPKTNTEEYLLTDKDFEI